MTDKLIEKLKNSRNTISPALREDLIARGESVIRPLIKALPSLNSFVVTADTLDILATIGGEDAYNALSALLEDSPNDNIPKRLISQTCIKGLAQIGTEKSTHRIIDALSFSNQALRITAIEELTAIAKKQPQLRSFITEKLKFSAHRETSKIVGEKFLDALCILNDPIEKHIDWDDNAKNQQNKPKEDIKSYQPQQSKPSSPIDTTHYKKEKDFIPLKEEIKDHHVVSHNDSIKYAYLTEEEQKALLEEILKEGETEEQIKEKLVIIESIGNSSNIQLIDELLTIIKKSTNPTIRDGAISALLKLSPGDPKLKLLILEHILERRVIGQTEAKHSLANALRVAQIGLKRSKNNNKPIGSFLFLGPTGVGKTELAKALAEALFDSEQKLIRLDMSEYTDMADKNKIIGSPPGYAGSDEGGRLTQAVLKHPQSVILFDEIEKAHPEIFNLFLHLLDDGRLTDSKGETVSFRDTIILMTSNIGSEYILEGIKQEYSIEQIKELVNDILKSSFKPEFLNRLNDYIIFKPLTEDELLKVFEIKIKPTEKVLQEKYQLGFEITKQAKEYVIEMTQKQEFGFSPRELNRIIDEEIVNPLSQKLLDLEIAESYQMKELIPRHGKVIITREENKLTLNICGSENKGKDENEE